MIFAAVYGFFLLFLVVLIFTVFLTIIYFSKNNVLVELIICGFILFFTINFFYIWFPIKENTELKIGSYLLTTDYNATVPEVSFSLGNKGYLKKLNKKVLFLPFITIISSLAGGAVASILLSLSVGESIAISAGMGWYSFSAIELSKVSVELGGIAFLSNIFRELLAIFLIPIIAKKIGSFESVSVAGATAMDSVLPIINRSNPAEISIISFYSGLVISIIVPILIPILVNIFSL